MHVDFVPLVAGAVDRVLPFMQRLYGQEGISFDPGRAVRVCEWFIANPDWGGVWMVRADGEDAGYAAITVASSLEFQGRFALLDELYIGESWRNRGLGPAAVDFAIEWARGRGFAAIRLEVGHENVHGRHIYGKAGFFLQGERRLMTKWLTEA